MNSRALLTSVLALSLAGPGCAGGDDAVPELAHHP